MNNKTVVVTGASGALGTAVCETLYENGLNVIGIDASPVKEVSSVCDLFFDQTDLTDPAQAVSVMKHLSNRHTRIAGLVNVAGGFIWETVEEGSLESWDRMWALNLKTCLNASRAALAHLQLDGGVILNISAAASLKAGAGMGAYAASKSAVSRLTESLSEELKPRRIRVNALLPTIIDTPANRKDMPEADPSLWIRPEELAEVAAFLLSDAASAINGALIPVSGRL